jgi:hypothetical protein
MLLEELISVPEIQVCRRYHTRNLANTDHEY